MKWKEVDIDILKAKFKTYGNLVKKIEDNYWIVKKQTEDIEHLKSIERWLEQSLEQSRTELKETESKAQESNKNVLEQNRTLDKLQTDISKAQDYLEQLNNGVKEWETKLKDLKQKAEYITEEQIERLKNAEKEWQSNLAKIETEIHNKKKEIETLEEKSKANENYSQKLDTLIEEKVNILQEVKWEIVDLEQNKNRIEEKRDVLNEEIKELLKQWKEIAVQYKVTKSWADRLDSLNNKFNS